MAEYFSTVLQASIKYYNKINKICKPVQEHLGVEYVSYHTVKANGTYTVAINKPSMVNII